MTKHYRPTSALRTNSRTIKMVSAAVAALLASVLAVKHLPNKPAAVADNSLYKVAYIYDGDTIKLDDGQHVRLIGIDTPESHPNPKLTRDVTRRHVDERTQLAMGKKAAQFTRRLLEGQSVRLEYDVEPRDRYGRTLAYLYLPDGTFVNAKIIREGYAYPLTVPPNVRHAHEFQQWFNEARQHHRGLWN